MPRVRGNSAGKLDKMATPFLEKEEDEKKAPSQPEAVKPVEEVTEKQPEKKDAVEKTPKPKKKKEVPARETTEQSGEQQGEPEKKKARTNAKKAEGGPRGRAATSAYWQSLADEADVPLATVKHVITAVKKIACRELLDAEKRFFKLHGVATFSMQTIPGRGSYTRVVKGKQIHVNPREAHKKVIAKALKELTAQVR